MTELDESRVPSLAAVMEIRRLLCAWLQNHALPLWDIHGVDRVLGGFHEEISTVGPHLSLVPSGRWRRGRVVARQIYVFDAGERMGWRSLTGRPVDHGCEYLFAHMHAGDGRLHTAVDPVSHAALPQFSLYEQAFYLFALARLPPAARVRFPVEQTAIRCLERLRTDYARLEGGFDESRPPTLPLRSNPHMHLLEAALEWTKAASEVSRAAWVCLAREIVGLCLTRFCDVTSGVVRENFDFQWRPLPAEDGRVVEPGHQFEWGWLLIQWASSPHAHAVERSTCLAAAYRLIDAGELSGVDPHHGVAVNEIWDDMTVKDGAAKLWPQTERLKAWCARLLLADSPDQAEYACKKIVMAANGMIKYFRRDVPGLWHETLFVDGTFAAGATKASSLYHLACAIFVLDECAATFSRDAARRAPAPALDEGRHA